MLKWCGNHIFQKFSFEDFGFYLNAQLVWELPTSKKDVGLAKKSAPTFYQIFLYSIYVAMP